MIVPIMTNLAATPSSLSRNLVSVTDAPTDWTIEPLNFFSICFRRKGVRLRRERYTLTHALRYVRVSKEECMVSLSTFKVREQINKGFDMSFVYRKLGVKFICKGRVV